MKSMNRKAVFITLATALIVAMAGGVAVGFFLKKKQDAVKFTPYIDISKLKVNVEKNTREFTLYTVEGISAQTISDDQVKVYLENAGKTYMSNGGVFKAIPATESGRYTLVVENITHEGYSATTTITGLKPVAWDPACVPAIDTTAARVDLKFSKEEYHYAVTGIKVSARENDEIALVLKNKDTGACFVPTQDTSDGTWYHTNLPACASGTYTLQANNLTSGEMSELVDLGGFTQLRTITTPTPAQLEDMYRTNQYQRYESCFNQGYTFVFSGDNIVSNRPHTNREICTNLRIHAWSGIKVLRVQCDCLGRIDKVYIKVIL